MIRKGKMTRTYIRKRLLIVTILLVSTLINHAAQAGWWDSVEEQTKTDAGNDAITTVASELKEQAETLGSKHYTASQMTKVMAGNKSVRTRSAQQMNIFSKYFDDLSRSGALKALGITATLADGPASMLGHLMYGDVTEVMTIATTETIEAASAAGGAAALGLVGLKIGTLIGGPPGAAIGGAIGSVIGGAAGAAGYTLTVGDEIEKLARYTFTANEISPQMKALLARIDDFKQKDAEKRMKAIGWEDAFDKEAVIVDSSISLPADLFDKGTSEQQTPKLRAAPSSDSAPSRPSAPVEDIKQERKRSRSTPEERRQLREDLAKKADRMSARGEGPSLEGYGATPAIPESATIDAVIWMTEYPDHKTNVTWYLNSGKFFMELEQSIEGSYYSGDGWTSTSYPSKFRYESSGTLQGNVIQSSGKYWYIDPSRNVQTGVRSEKQGEEYVRIPFTCETITQGTGNTTETIYLNIDGTLTIDATYSYYPEISITGQNCNRDPEDTRKAWREANASAAQSYQSIGIWQLRK